MSESCSDAGSVLIHPGFVLHEELRMLVEDAGLTPLEALWSATLGPARFAGQEAKLGNIRNTRRISAVVQGGHLYTRNDLDGLLDRARRE